MPRKDDARLLAILDARPPDHVQDIEPVYLDDDTTHKLEVWDLGILWDRYGTRQVFGYRFYSGAALVFESVDLSGPTGMSARRAAAEALCFLTLRPGDVEDDYFDDYTPAQIEWRDTYAEDLAGEVFDLLDQVGVS